MKLGTLRTASPGRYAALVVEPFLLTILLSGKTEIQANPLPKDVSIVQFFAEGKHIVIILKSAEFAALNKGELIPTLPEISIKRHECPQPVVSVVPVVPVTSEAVADTRRFYTEFREDGWPFCPVCEEDELYSLEMLAYRGDGEKPTLDQCLAGEMRCYVCQWSNRKEPQKRG